MLTPALPNFSVNVSPQRLLQRARAASVLLEQAAMQNKTCQIQRAMRGVAFAMTPKNVRRDPASAL
jgi:hypothetical protein